MCVVSSMLFHEGPTKYEFVKTLHNSVRPKNRGLWFVVIDQLKNHCCDAYLFLFFWVIFFFF